MENPKSRNSFKLQKQISRGLAIVLMVALLFAGKSLITNLRDTPTTVEGHAQLKTNVQFRPVEGEPTNVPGFSKVSGVVDRVVDGDTVEFTASYGRNFRLRLLGIDAPELRQSESGKTSKGYLQKQLGYCSNEVTVIYNQEDSFDAYGRLLGKILCNEKDLNLDLVKSGHAWVYTEYENEMMPGDPSIYSKAENQAQANNLGLWTEKNPERPWEWRLKAKSSSGNDVLSDFYSWIRKRMGF